jgi:hypothetical protein
MSIVELLIVMKLNIFLLRITKCMHLFDTQHETVERRTGYVTQ